MLSRTAQDEITVQVLAEQESQTEAAAGPDRKREKSPPEEKTHQNTITNNNHTEMGVEARS